MPAHEPTTDLFTAVVPPHGEEPARWPVERDDPPPAGAPEPGPLRVSVPPGWTGRRPRRRLGAAALAVLLVGAAVGAVLVDRARSGSATVQVDADGPSAPATGLAPPAASGAPATAPSTGRLSPATSAATGTTAPATTAGISAAVVGPPRTPGRATSAPAPPGTTPAVTTTVTRTVTTAPPPTQVFLLSVAASASSVTGPAVPAGSTVTVTAAGGALLGGASSDGCPAEATFAPSGLRTAAGSPCGTRTDGGALVPATPIGVLLTDRGTGWTAVGTSGTVRATTATTIRFAVNDGFRGDNSGSYDVRVTVTSPA